MNLSQFLGDVYGTNGSAHSQEDLEKNAQLNMFFGLCKQAGISLEEIQNLSDSEIEYLFKVATEGEEDENKKEEDSEDSEDSEESEESESKSAQARSEWEEKRAAAAKLSEAEFLGRVMAHSYVNELQKLAAEAQNVSDEGASEESDKEKKEEKAEEKKANLARRLRKVASVNSSTANLDEVAGNFAIDLLKQAGVDADVATARVNAAYILGLPESEKIASANNFEQAVYYRALEFCEKAGFPVDWSKA